MKKYIFLILLQALEISCQVILPNFFPFETAAGDTKLAQGDDSGAGPLSISIGYPFFGTTKSSLYVNVNGALTFDGVLTLYTPVCAASTGGYGVVMPYWSDVDTTFTPDGTVWYRQSTSADDVNRATVAISNAFPTSFCNIRMTWVFVATWYNVTYYGYTCNSPRQCKNNYDCAPRNTYQAILTTDGVHSFIIFNYNNITWTTGCASNCISSCTGMGGCNSTCDTRNTGYPARVGFDAGDGVNLLNAPNSCTDAIVGIEQTSNVGVPGQLVYRVDTNTNNNPDVTRVNCVPTTIVDTTPLSTSTTTSISTTSATTTTPITTTSTITTPFTPTTTTPNTITTPTPMTTTSFTTATNPTTTSITTPSMATSTTTTPITTTTTSSTSTTTPTTTTTTTSSTTTSTTTSNQCCQIGGVWSEWSDSGACNDTCGSCGVIPRTRTCLSSPNCPCSGPSTRLDNCNFALCAYPRDSCCAPYNDTKLANGTVICGPQPEPFEPEPLITGCMPNCCPAQGVWSQWSEPIGCSDTCGACGVGTRQRYCMTEGNGCPCTGDNTQNVPCNLMPCKYPKKSCCIGSVQNFNGTIKCTVTTSIETPASLSCATVNQLATSVCCPSGGTWSEWSTSQTCSDTCGSCGQLTYTRTCTSAPNCPCSGSSSKTVNCNLTPCLYPKNSCCGSYKTMFASGQAICGPQPVEPDDTPSDSIVCTTVPGAVTGSTATCAPGGEWSSWTQGTCSDDCGMCGTQINTRICLSQSRGCPCSGSSTESVACAPADCKYPRPTCCSGYTSSVVDGSFICVLKNG